MSFFAHCFTLLLFISVLHTSLHPICSVWPLLERGISLFLSSVLPFVYPFRRVSPHDEMVVYSICHPGRRSAHLAFLGQPLSFPRKLCRAQVPPLPTIACLLLQSAPHSLLTALFSFLYVSSFICFSLIISTCRRDRPRPITTTASTTSNRHNEGCTFPLTTNDGRQQQETQWSDEEAGGTHTRFVFAFHFFFSSLSVTSLFLYAALFFLSVHLFL